MTAAANATDKACLIMSFISFWVLICISPCLKKSAKLLSPFKNVHSSSPPRRIVPPAAAVAATRSASDSVFRCRKEKWFRLQRSWRLRGPRPILFFVAAKKIGSACRTPLAHGCSDSGFQGSNLGIAARKPSRTAKLLHRFLILGPDLGIDARFSSETAFFVHRFLNSSPNLRIDACFSPFKPSCVHRFLNSIPDLGIDARCIYLKKVDSQQRVNDGL